MGFTESVKTEAKRRSHYACVWCQHTEQFIEVHHIVPQEENGPDTLDNAAPLCPNCHTIIGNNTDVRKQLRERRDWWWTYCDSQQATLPTEDTAQRLDELVSSLKAVEEQGGRNETLLTEIKSQVLGQLTAQATAVSAASTTSQLIMATGPINPTAYQVTATATFSGSQLRDGMPDPYHSYFVVSSKGGITRPTGDTQFGAVVTIIPVAGDSAELEQQLFAPGGSPEDGMELALRTLRALPQNQGLKEEFYRRTERAV
jgi:hypothetical protein